MGDSSELLNSFRVDVPLSGPRRAPTNGGVPHAFVPAYARLKYTTESPGAYKDKARSARLPPSGILLLEWRFPTPSEEGEFLLNGWRIGAPIQDSLWNFVRLEDSDDNAVLSFAQKYGVLGPCKHKQPGVHDGCIPLWFIYKDQPDQRWYFEQISTWRRQIKMIRSCLAIANALNNDQETRVGDWLTFLARHIFDDHCDRMLSEAVKVTSSHVLGKYLDLVGAIYEQIEEIGDQTFMGSAAGISKARESFRSNLEKWLVLIDQRSLLADHLTYWMDIASLTPTMIWTNGIGRPKVGMNLAGSAGVPPAIGSFWPPNSLYTVLIAQLASVLTSQHGVAYCDSCHNPYEPKRLRSDRPNYCTNCQGLAPKRDWYHRNKSKKSDIPETAP